MSEPTGGSVESERDAYKVVLAYIASPTMSRPSNVDPAQWAMEGAEEWIIRLALQTCIRMATTVLAQQSGRGQS